MFGGLSREYDHKALRKYLLILFAYAGLSFVTRGFAFILVPILLFTSLARQKLVDMLFWVMVLCFIGVANVNVFRPTAITFLIVRASLFMVTGILMTRVFGRRNARIVAPFAGIFFYIGWEALISVQGFDPIVSYLKIILFIPIYLALYSVANEVTATTRLNARAVRSAILAMIVFIVFASLMLWPFPGISQLSARTIKDAAKIAEMIASGNSLFTGITNHSQALGPMLGVMLTVLVGDLLFSIKKWDPLYLATLVVGVFLIFKTSSRTALGTFMAGTMMMIWLFTMARKINPHWKTKVMSGAFLGGILLFVGIFAVPSIRDRMLNFVLKVQSNTQQATSEDFTFENVTSSRQEKIDIGLANFKNKPLTGNGFQVSEEMESIERTSFMDYISAPIEKGVWITAILEEGGVPGLILFGGFILVTVVTLVKRHAYIGAGTLFVFAVVNLGEFNFFSMAYTGGFEWSFVFAAVILDGQRMKSVGLQVFDVPIEVIIAEEGIDMYTRRLA